MSPRTDMDSLPDPQFGRVRLFNAFLAKTSKFNVDPHSDVPITKCGMHPDIRTTPLVLLAHFANYDILE